MLVRGRVLYWLVPALLGLTCTSAGSSRAPLAVQLSTSQALLEDIDSLVLYVLPATEETRCTTETGLLPTGPEASGLASQDSSGASALKFTLTKTLSDGSPCPEQGAFCSDQVTLPTNPDAPLVFQAIGFQQGQARAVGCVSAAVNADPFYLTIGMLRYVAPSVCGNGLIEIGEQCEGNGGPPAEGDPLCDQQCQSKEVLLSNDNAGAGGRKITNAPAGSKNHVSLGWSQAPTETNPNPFHAVFQDTNFGTSGGGPEVNYRQMTQDLLPIESPALLKGQIRLPQSIGSWPGFDQRPGTQSSPSLSTLSDGSLLTAFEDNRTGTGQTNITLTHITPIGTAAAADQLNVNKRGTNHCVLPAVAEGPANQALIVWTDTTDRKVRARIWDNGVLRPDSDIELGPASANEAHVAGSASGWQVVWSGPSNLDSADILSVSVGADGAVGSIQTVNQKSTGTQDLPHIAMLPTGERIVTWRDGDAIMMQRFDSSGSPLASDQVNPVNTASQQGAGLSPTVSASPLAEGFYAVAWQGSDQIFARLLSSQQSRRYLFNPVDGQEGAFTVSRSDTAGKRSAPAVTIGGSGHIVFAWQDDSSDHAGIYARRFPLPQP